MHLHQLVFDPYPLENGDVIYGSTHRGYSFDPTIPIRGGSKHFFLKYLVFKGDLIPESFSILLKICQNDYPENYLST